MKNLQAQDGTEPTSSTTPSQPSDPTKPAGAPESYADFATPENFQLDKALLAEAAPIFKDLNLSQDQAQRLVDWYSKTQIANSKKSMDTVNEMRASWRDAVSKDPDIGGKIDQVKSDIGKAFNAVDDRGNRIFSDQLVKDFKSAMDLTGAGDHPAIIKTIWKALSQLNEGTHVSGHSPSPLGQVPNGQDRRPTPASAMFPNLPSSTR